MADRTVIDANILASYRTILRALDRIVLPRLVELGISMPQFKALIAVASAAPRGISVTQLGAELSIGQPSASLIVDQLERLGYVERTADTVDRRRVLVVTTPLGAEIGAELRHGRRSTFVEWVSGVEDADAEALERGLRSLARVVDTTAAGS